MNMNKLSRVGVDQNNAHMLKLNFCINLAGDGFVLLLQVQTNPRGLANEQ